MVEDNVEATVTKTVNTNVYILNETVFLILISLVFFCYSIVRKLHDCK